MDDLTKVAIVTLLNVSEELVNLSRSLSFRAGDSLTLEALHGTKEQLDTLRTELHSTGIITRRIEAVECTKPRKPVDIVKDIKRLSGRGLQDSVDAYHHFGDNMAACMEWFETQDSSDAHIGRVQLIKDKYSIK